MVFTTSACPTRTFCKTRWRRRSRSSRLRVALFQPRCNWQIRSRAAATVDRGDGLHSDRHLLRRLAAHQRCWYRWTSTIPGVGPIFRERRGSAVSELRRHGHQLLDQSGVVYQRAAVMLTRRTRSNGTLPIQRQLKGGWAIETGYVGSHFLGGIGIWDPFQAIQVSPSSPLTVRDRNGVAYTITANTVNNEELRHQIIGLSRKRGSRYSSNIGFAQLQFVANHPVAAAASRPLLPGCLHLLEDRRQCQRLAEHGRVECHSRRPERRRHLQQSSQRGAEQSAWRL